MGGKGNKGPQDTNSQIVGMQLQQSQQAAAANDQRNARLNYGKNAIQQLFEGTPSGSSLLDLSSISQGNAPASGMNPQISAAMNWGYSHGSDPNLLAQLRTMAQGSRKPLGQGYSWGIAPDTGGSTPGYAIYDASGRMVDEASNLSDLAAAKIYTGGDPNTKTGGFGDDFYNKYRQSILDYYMPQEGDQYNTARSDLAASLARAGTLDSSLATFDIGKLSKQDALNRAQIASGADTQTGTLRTTISQDEQSALNQLYSTEDPTVAANTAGNMVANAQISRPQLNPAGALFAPITAGVGNALTGFLNPTSYINPNAGGVAQTSNPNQDYAQVHTAGA
jgi:hypothetical protein